MKSELGEGPEEGLGAFRLGRQVRLSNCAGRVEKKGGVERWCSDEKSFLAKLVWLYFYTTCVLVNLL